MNGKQWQAIRGFITDKGAVPLTSWDCIRGGVECIEKNTENMKDRERDSAKQRRDMHKELLSLKKAVESLSLNTRESLSHFLMPYMREAGGMKSIEAYRIGGEYKAIAAAVDSAVFMLTKDTKDKRKRGDGWLARRRRGFIREAAGLFVEAGFKKIGVGAAYLTQGEWDAESKSESVFCQWLVLLDSALDIRLLTKVNKKGFIESKQMKTAIEKAIGKAAEDRAHYVSERIAKITRTYSTLH